MKVIGWCKFSLVAVALTVWCAPALCQDSGPDSVPATTIQPASATQDATDSAPAKRPTFREKIKRIVDAVPSRIKLDRDFKVASALFPSFCQHWGQNLRDRESNNRNHLNFIEKDGYETATYTGYGKIEECESHQSKGGYSIGKITYEEFIFYLTGKTPDEAKIAAPQTISDTHTTELFRWDNNKWFY
jgi:hypothetical protein